MALRWEGYGESEGCLGVSSLISRVEGHLGRRAFDPDSPQVLNISVDMPPGGGLRAVVRVLDAQGRVLGERELQSEESHCSALDEPLVLAVALLVDADLGSEPTPEPEPEPEPEPPPPPEPLFVPRAAKEPEPIAPPEPWRAETDLALLGTDGVAPQFAFGAELGLLVDPPVFFPWRVRVAGYLPQRVELEPTGTLDFATGLAGLQACPLSVRSEAFGVDGCLGADVVVELVESSGLIGSRDATQWLLQGSLSLRVIAELPGPWFGTMGTGVGIPVAAPEYVYGRNGDTISIFQMADVTLTAGLGLGIRVTP